MYCQSVLNVFFNSAISISNSFYELQVLLLLSQTKRSLPIRIKFAHVTGSDDDSNHKIVRKLACDQFENETTEKLRRTGFFSHSATDCITERACKKINRHNDAYVGASVLPYRRIVKNKEVFTKQMRKNKVWGNE